MSRQKIIEALQKDLSDEMAAIIQYMQHHYVAEGMESPSIIEIFKKTSIDEMKHAEMLAERIVYLGGEPTTTLSRVKKGGNLKKMIKDDLDSENDAIKQYKEHIKLCGDLGDSVTRLMLEKILTDEEGHADTWETILGIKK
ncbi:MAG: ferritin-like domain-containing protein [Acidobacteriota bacterium]